MTLPDSSRAAPARVSHERRYQQQLQILSTQQKNRDAFTLRSDAALPPENRDALNLRNDTVLPRPSMTLPSVIGQKRP